MYQVDELRASVARSYTSHIVIDGGLTAGLLRDQVRSGRRSSGLSGHPMKCNRGDLLRISV
jgi:hypothetical protein